MKKSLLIVLVLVIIAAFTLTACDVVESGDSSTNIDNGVQASGTSSDAESTTSEITAEVPTVSEEDRVTAWDESSAHVVTLNSTSIDYSGIGGTVSGTTFTITKAGTFSFSGSLTDGQIVVNAHNCTVRIILKGVNVNCSNSAAIYIKDADKVIITLQEGTVNTLSDGASYVYDNTEDEEPSATIFSKDDLTINGSGTLNVDANFNDAIQSKDSLFIIGGIYNITSADDAIIGKDQAYIENGTFTINASGDGIKSTNDNDTTVGNVIIENGTFNITAGADGIQAENCILISAGTFNITTGGGSSYSLSSSDTGSYKCLKAGVDITLEGGTYDLNGKDDCVHSNSTITISGVIMTLTSGDDGVHADKTLNINSGTIDIKKSYEGLESLYMYLNGGTVTVNASDDGINVAGGDGSTTSGRPGQNSFWGMGGGMGGGMPTSSSNGTLTMNGGNYYVFAAGDGVDVNGSATMNGGTLLINGPTDNGNGALDYDGTFTMNGGILVAIGSSGMAQTPSNSSSQKYISLKISGSKSAGTIVAIKNSSGETVIAYKAAKTFSSFVVSTPEITSGTYSVYYGGSIEGDLIGGTMAQDGSYTDGTKNTTVTVS